MNPAWIAVVGTAVGAMGATAAALIAGWSARRQTTHQSLSQEMQWHREKRRDSYSSFLDSGVQARDELASIWRLLRASDPDIEQVVTRLEEARPLVQDVRRASATVFVLGPQEILEWTRRAEESIVLFHNLLRAAAKDLRQGNEISHRIPLCIQQDAQVRDILDRFAASAREVLTGTGATSALLPSPPPAQATEELTWLVARISEALDIPESEIDTSRPLFEAGLDSLAVLEITSMADKEFHLEKQEAGWLISSLLFAKTIEEVATHLAAQRHPA
ncbi:acyl carrier protein [Spirillospora sp. NPDC047279]|uniref:acyl carrier protein n=1 Tax=Spirillospora sp. NPDC047279 TaxID=3155478 RepID=UPI0033CD369B